jgi:hypothetical protein
MEYEGKKLAEVWEGMELWEAFSGVGGEASLGGVHCYFVSLDLQ